MSTQELRLRYFIQLASNIGLTAKKEAQDFERAQDQMTRATRQTDRSARDLHHTLTTLANNTSMERQVGYFDRLAASIGRARDQARQLQQLIGRGVNAGMQVGAGGAAAIYAAGRLTESPMSFDYQLRQAALTAYGDKGPAGVRQGMGVVRGRVDGAVRDFGGTRDQALSGYKSLIGSGEFSAEEVEKMLPVVQETAVGTATEVTKLAALATRLKSIMKIPQQEMRTAFSRIARVGQLGGVEIDQQAGFIADLAGEYGAIGYEGQRGAVAASVDLQLAFKAAGSADAARTLLSNFYGKTLASDTAKDFSKIKGKNGKPIDLYSEIAARRAQGEDGVEAFMSLADEVIGRSGGGDRIKNVLAGANLKDPAQLDAATRAASDVFSRAGLVSFIQDKEAMRGYLALSQQRGLRRSMMATAMSDTGQTMDTMSAIVQESPEVQKQKALAEAAIAADRAFQSLLEPINGVVGGATQLAQQFPGLAAGLAGLTAAATVAASAWGAAGALALLSRGGGGAAVGAAGAGAAGAAAAGLAPGLAARLGSAGRWLGPVASLGLAGVESYDVITDEKLTAMGKTKGVTAAVGGAAGAWGGAQLGMAAGAFAGPAGLLLGGLAGGALGYMGGKAGVNWLWGDNPERDYLQVSGANGANLGSVQPGGQATVQLGEGVLQVQITVNGDGTYGTTANMAQPMQLLRVEAGSTNPGSFASVAGGFR